MHMRRSFSANLLPICFQFDSFSAVHPYGFSRFVMICHDLYLKMAPASGSVRNPTMVSSPAKAAWSVRALTSNRPVSWSLTFRHTHVHSASSQQCQIMASYRQAGRQAGRQAARRTDRHKDRPTCPDVNPVKPSTLSDPA